MSSHGDLSIEDRRATLRRALSDTAEGNREALRQVYDLTSGKLLAIILRIVGEREAAEDVLQDVYIKVWNRAGRYDPALASPITWLAAIARNSAIDAMRKAGRGREIADDALPEVEDDAPRADDMLCSAQDADRLHRCLDGLQDEHRKSIRLAFFRGYTHTELAEKLGVPLGTMKSWIRRGLASLRGCLGDA